MSFTIDPNGSFTKGTTTLSVKNKSMVIPSGNTLQRPSTLEAGMIRFNTDLNYIEGYDGYLWVKIGA